MLIKRKNQGKPVRFWWWHDLIAVLFGAALGHDDDARKIADWLPTWAYFAAILLAIAASCCLARFF